MVGPYKPTGRNSIVSTIGKAAISELSDGTCYFSEVLQGICILPIIGPLLADAERKICNPVSLIRNPLSNLEAFQPILQRIVNRLNIQRNPSSVVQRLAGFPRYVSPHIPTIYCIPERLGM